MAVFALELKIVDGDSGISSKMKYRDEDQTLFFSEKNNLRMDILTIEYLSHLLGDDFDLKSVVVTDESEINPTESKIFFSTGKKLYHMRNGINPLGIIQDQTEYLKINKEMNRHFPYSTIILKDRIDKKYLIRHFGTEDSLIFTDEDLRNSKARKKLSTFHLLDIKNVKIDKGTYIYFNRRICE